MSEKKKLFSLLVISIFTLTVYGQIITHDFIDLDFEEYFSRNPMVPKGLSLEGITWAFTTAHWNWHPITWLSHMVDVELYGMNPAGHHFTSLVIHLLNALLLFKIFATFSKNTFISLVIALLFAIHPMHVEPVVWTAARKDLLSTFFGFSSIFFYLFYYRDQKTIHYNLSIVAFALSLMSKAQFVSLPLILILIDYWYLKDKIKIKNLINKIPFFVLSIAISLTTIFAQKEVDALRSTENITIFARIVNTCISYIEYIIKLYIPIGLTIFYPYRYELDFGQFLACMTLLVFITYLVIKQRNNRTYLFVGWFFFLITLIPMIGLVQIGAHASADRYTYMTYLGLFIIIAYGINDICNIKSSFKPLIYGVSACAILALSVVAFNQVAIWKDSESIFKHTIKHTSDNDLIHTRLGTALLRKGKFDEAVYHYKVSLRLNPIRKRTYKNMGDAYLKKGDYNKAIENYNILIKLIPDDHRGYNNIGIALMKMGMPNEAEPYFQKALAIKPDYAFARKNLEMIRQNKKP